MKPTRLTSFIISLCFLCCFLPFKVFGAGEKYVRVLILKDVSSLRLKIKGLYEIKKQDSVVLLKGRNLSTTIAAYKNGLMAAGKNFNEQRIFVHADESEALTVNDRFYRGDIQILRNKDGTLSIINFLELEDYIKGVLYHEVSHYWPMEALKAQAIVSRTYAVYQGEENKKRDYDVFNDVYSQVYGGRGSERYRTNKAVEDTAGLILTYKGKPFPAFFHATCGGHTEDASSLWNIDIAPLKGVVCDFCQDSPHFNWNCVLKLTEVEERLESSGLGLGKIKNIEIAGRDRSGRAKDLNIFYEKNTLRIAAKDFRAIVGLNIIRSTNFSLFISKGDVVFEGRGWGHGAGLCQWGAYFMAKQGKNALEILKYYYPKSNVANIGF